jgi:hypothetical protein
MTGAGKSNVIGKVTEELLAALEFRYAQPRVCRVCGAPLQVADSRGMKMTCTSDAASPVRAKHEAAGVTWKQALDHYEQSTMYDPPDGDPRVLALIAEVRRLREAGAPPSGEHWRLEGYDTFSGDWYGLEPSYGSYEEALAGARRRLADLERSQPAASSGGQGGIQDQMHVIHPGGRRQRVT